MKSQNFQNIVQRFDTIKNVRVQGLRIVVSGIVKNNNVQEAFEYNHGGVARAVASKVIQFKDIE